VDTYPDLQALVISILVSWRTNTNPAIGTPSQLQELVRSQEYIGWDRFFEGFVSIEWREIQHQYYVFLKSRRTRCRWVVELLKKLWDVSWELWEHRNSALHEAESRPATRDVRQIGLTIPSIFQSLNSYKPLRSNDAHLISTPLAVLLKKELIFNQEWLRQASASLAAIKSSRWNGSTRLPRMLQGMQRNLRAWLRQE
jgi:hypothetical protein